MMINVANKDKDTTIMMRPVDFEDVVIITS
jgi:hypothetical protein